jgi:putative solute:sodium symporter small subunit
MCSQPLIAPPHARAKCVDGQSSNRTGSGHHDFGLSPSYGAGILLADWLDQFRIAGFKLGFWFAQQGSIYVFVALIFVYVWRMNKLDREHDVHED